jgi:hypothetical protein
MYLAESIGDDLGMSRAYVNHVGRKRWYSSINAQIYFNEVLINELIQIQWTEQENLMPIFGYNSYVWDEIALGSRITQGVFAINFIIPDYLHHVINDQLDTDENIEYTNGAENHAANKKQPKNKKNGFMISIGYGDKNYVDKITGKEPYIYLENVHIQSVGQALDTQGGGIVEIYRFYSRDRGFKR